MQYINYYEEFGHHTGYGLEEQDNYNKIVSEPQEDK